MSDTYVPARIPAFLARLERIWLECPDIRLGQLLVNALTRPEGSLTENELFNIEDSALMEKLEAFQDRRKATVSEQHQPSYRYSETDPEGVGFWEPKSRRTIG